MSEPGERDDHEVHLAGPPVGDDTAEVEIAPLAAAPDPKAKATPDPGPPPVEATGEFPSPEDDPSAAADPRNAESPMSNDWPGGKPEGDDHETGSGAPNPWPFG